MRGKTKAVAAAIRERIASGEYPPGSQLPRLQDLRREFGVGSITTMNAVLRLLESEGLLVVRHGSGIYVRKPHVVLRDLVAGLRVEYRLARGEEPPAVGIFEAVTGAEGVTVTTEYQRMPAPERAAALLQCPYEAEVLERTFRVMIGDVPHQESRSYMLAATADRAGLTGPEVEQPGATTMAQLLAVGIVVDRVRLIIGTRMPTAEETTSLAILPGTPVFAVWRPMFAGDDPVEVSVTVVPGDQVAYVAMVELGGDS